MKNALIIATIILTLCIGCTSISIQTTKNWEGHFMSTNDFHKATSNIQLEENETVWVLSNRTLKRVLKNTGK